MIWCTVKHPPLHDQARALTPQGCNLCTPFQHQAHVACQQLANPAHQPANPNRPAYKKTSSRTLLVNKHKRQHDEAGTVQAGHKPCYMTAAHCHATAWCMSLDQGPAGIQAVLHSLQAPIDRAEGPLLSGPRPWSVQMHHHMCAGWLWLLTTTPSR